MAIPRRGLQDIRTLTGKVSKSKHPYMAYLRISHIEMEKARKNRESDKAKQLVADIAAQLAEIEGEKDELLQVVGERRATAPRPKPKPARSAGGFKIRY